MLKSMTAYGRGEIQALEGHFVAEISSVNRKYLDLSLQLPKEFACFESEIRKWLGSQIFRGQVTLRVFFFSEGLSAIKVHPNIPLAKELKAAWDEIGEVLNSKKDFQLSLLKDQPDIFTFDYSLDNKEEILKLLKEAIDQALKGFSLMKEKEGSSLQKDILDKLKDLKSDIDTIAQLAPNAVNKYREKLEKRLTELSSGSSDLDIRLMQEVAIFAEKLDTAEEITRFNSHLVQFQDTLNLNESVGKNLDFLIQELFRETNTLMSKSSDLQIVKLGLKIKNTLEKIREQIQNIE